MTDKMKVGKRKNKYFVVMQSIDKKDWIPIFGPYEDRKDATFELKELTNGK